MIDFQQELPSPVKLMWEAEFKRVEASAFQQANHPTEFDMFKAGDFEQLLDRL